MKWQSLFHKASWKGLALKGIHRFFGCMIQWLRESWEMTSITTIVVRVLILILAAVSLVGIVWFSRNWQVTEAEELSDVTMYKTRDIGSDIRSLDKGKGPVQLLGIAERAVLDRHFVVLGGLDKLSSISSLRFSGKVTFNSGLVQDVVVIKKGGVSMRTSVKTKQVQTTRVVTEKESWRAVWVNGQLVEVLDLTDKEAEDSFRYINVASELYLAQQNDWRLSYQGMKDFNYKMAHAFELVLDPRHTVVYFIEPKTFLDLGRVDRVFEADGTFVVTRRVHSEHFDANGITLPGKIDIFQNGELVQVFDLWSAQFNSGVLDSVFQRPKLQVTP
jgi:hypothetical protein